MSLGGEAFSVKVQLIAAFWRAEKAKRAGMNRRDPPAPIECRMSHHVSMMKMPQQNLLPQHTLSVRAPIILRDAVTLRSARGRLLIALPAAGWRCRDSRATGGARGLIGPRMPPITPSPPRSQRLGTEGKIPVL
jgi:hypothetical protein